MEISSSTNFHNEPLTETSILSSFYCGIEEMDSFIHDALQSTITANACKAFCLYAEDEVVAIYAMNFDSLILKTQEAYDLLHRDKDPIDIKLEYEDIFKSEQSHPALEISYLAVRNDCQQKKLGTLIVDHIIEEAKSQTLGGCQFITVSAYDTHKYSAIGFYEKCGFTKTSGGGRDSARMFRPLFTLPDEYFNFQ